jgi:uncharacterized membrane protein
MVLSAMTTETEKQASGEKETGRIEAFSDGVFSVALTLLVVDLRPPHLAHEGVSQFWEAMGRMWPAYFAFVTSFASVLIMWVHHHTIFRLARRPDAALLFANGFLLLMVVIVPFPTAVVSDYLSTPVARSACLFYSSIFVVLAISFRLLLWAVLRQCRLSGDAVQRLRRSYRLGPPGYLLAALAALLSAWLSLAIVTALWILWAVVAARSEPCEA